MTKNPKDPAESTKLVAATFLITPDIKEKLADRAKKTNTKQSAIVRGVLAAFLRSE